MRIKVDKHKLNKTKRFTYIVIGIIFIITVINFYTTFSLINESYKFESEVYSINDKYIENISSNTNVELFSKYFELENCYIEVIDDTGKLEKNNVVTNGSKTILYDTNKNVISTYINIIKGDLTNDGIINDNDLNKIGECLVNDCSLEEYQVKSLDIDNDSSVHINDLLLLDKAITLGYTSLSLKQDSLTLQSNEQGRLVAITTPNYGVNQNVKWVSLSGSIATVDQSGIVTGHNEGETKIQAITQDEKIITEATIKVDNTIQLESYEGIGYVGGKDVKVKIKLIDYENVTCTSSNSTIAKCSIDGKYLIIKALGQGNASITVTTPNYGEAVYNLTTYSVYLNVIPKYLCTTPGNINYITVSGFNTGNLSFNSSNTEIIKDAYMEEILNRNMLKIIIGNTQGRATLNVKESNGNKVNDIIIDVTSISIPEIGKVTKIGEEISTTIIGNNLGELSCIPEDESKAICKIEGNKLIVTPLQKGAVNIDVYNKFNFNNSIYDCGKSEFLVVIEE